MGMKLVQEVQDYVNAIESREIDILTAMVEMDTLKHSLESTNIKLSKVSQVNQVNPAPESVISRVCELARRKLETVLDLVRRGADNWGELVGWFMCIEGDRSQATLIVELARAF